MDSLIKIDGKPIEKLLEVVSNGLGLLYRPRAMRKEADAKAYEIKVIGKAQAESNAESRLIEAECLDKLNERLIAKESRRQNNIDDVVEIAASQLNEEHEIIEETVNQDWATRFFDIVQDISNEEMKNLWGRILAGEVKRPKSYSLRTLEVLRNITSDEAELFVKVAQFVLEQDELFIFDGDGKHLSQFGVSYLDMARLNEIGLIRQDTVNKQFVFKKDTNINVIYQKLIILINIKSNVNKFSIPGILLTKAGEELYSMIQTTPNMDYIKDFANSIKNDNISVKYSTIVSIKNDNITYNIPLFDL